MFQYVCHKRLELVVGSADFLSLSSSLLLFFLLLNPASYFCLLYYPYFFFLFSPCLSTSRGGYIAYDLMILSITRYATPGPMDRLVSEYE